LVRFLSDTVVISFTATDMRESETQRHNYFN
jgi:hypothetical protein